MRSATTSWCAALLGLCAATMTCAPEALDDVTWACTSSEDCGPGARCTAGRCERLEPGERVDTCRLDLPSGRVDAELVTVAGAKQLRLTYRGQPTTIPLPPGVRAVSVPTCCEHACCAGAR